MHLHTSGILELLRAKTGRYIEQHKELYVMKEADGSNVFLIENGENQHIHPSESQIHELLEAGHLILEDSRYELP
jgi:hypothetical protein